MAKLVILNQQAGPLPLKEAFSLPTDGPATITIFGSCWSQSTGVNIGISVAVDGQQIGTAGLYSNDPATHRTVVPAAIPVQLAFGTHALTLANANADTTTDYYDLFTVVVDY